MNEDILKKKLFKEEFREYVYEELVKINITLQSDDSEHYSVERTHFFMAVVDIHLWILSAVLFGSS